MTKTPTTISLDQKVPLPYTPTHPWSNPVPTTLAMEDIVEDYLNHKGIDYCVDLHHFMNNVERE